jgi:Phosphoserine phosphatase RsbU, N-terminal domain
VVNPDPRLRQNYAAAFTRFLFRKDEAALSAAYELGRRGLESGVSLLHIVQIHHGVLIEALPGIEGPQELADAAASFLVEVLASYDMAQRALMEQRDATD